LVSYDDDDGGLTYDDGNDDDAIDDQVSFEQKKRKKGKGKKGKGKKKKGKGKGKKGYKGKKKFTEELVPAVVHSAPVDGWIGRLDADVRLTATSTCRAAYHCLA